MTHMTVTHHVAQLLEIAQTELKKGERLTEQTGQVNVKGDQTIAMDARLESLFIEYIQANNIPADIFSEEIGVVSYKGKAELLIAFDPLDGSTNYRIGQGMLPYGSLFAIYSSPQPKLSDLIAAGAYEATQDISWLYDGTKTVNLKTGKDVVLEQHVEINKKTSIYIDLYYQEALKLFYSTSGKMHIRWNGSNISALLYTLTGISTAMGAIGMRAEEIGAMVGLISGAGGVVKKTNGDSLLTESFAVDGRYPLLAGVGNVVEFITHEVINSSFKKDKI